MSQFPFEFSEQSKPIVVFGRDGQVGKALQLILKDHRVPVVFLGRSDCDLSNELEIRSILNLYQPHVIINAAAYTAVNKAESISQKKLAFSINSKAPAVMAQYVSNLAYGILVHYSTDYVFADSKKIAYLETDTAGPFEKLSVYGQSKLAGEQAIQDIFNYAYFFKNFSNLNLHRDGLAKYFILRTSWVYGDGDNFIRTMLRLAGEHNQLEVVADQVGVPTSAVWLAEIGIQMVESGAESGIYHAVPDGETSWHKLAVFAIEVAYRFGMRIKVKAENILPILARDYRFQVPRPYNSKISNAKLKKTLSKIYFAGKYPHWQEQVEAYVRDYIKASRNN